LVELVINDAAGEMFRLAVDPQVAVIGAATI
jgi:hypothetical protein